MSMLSGTVGKKKKRLSCRKLHSVKKSIQQVWLDIVHTWVLKDELQKEGIFTTIHFFMLSYPITEHFQLSSQHFFTVSFVYSLLENSRIQWPLSCHIPRLYFFFCVIPLSCFIKRIVSALFLLPSPPLITTPFLSSPPLSSHSSLSHHSQLSLICFHKLRLPRIWLSLF